MVRRKTAAPARAIRASTRETQELCGFYPSIVLNYAVDSTEDADARVRLSIAEKHLHPLAGTADIPPLTDLQAVITQAILQRGNSCSFETIYQSVLPRWRVLRRRDGTHYTSDCRRAVLMNLRPSSHFPSLFRCEASSWRVCITLEEAKAASLDPPPADLDSADSDGDIAADVRHDALPGAHELLPLTELQTLISEAIAVNGGSAPFDYIYDHVCRNRKKLKGRDGQPRNTDAKRAILASLSKNINSQPLFQRDSCTSGAWMLGVYNPHYSRLNATVKAEPNDNFIPASASEMLAGAVLSATPASPAPMADLVVGKEQSKDKDEPQVTDLHEKIAEAIACSPLAMADEAHITAYVTARWEALAPRLTPAMQALSPDAAVRSALQNVSSSLVRRLSRSHSLFTLGRRGRVWATETGRMTTFNSLSAGSAVVHAAPTAYGSFVASLKKRSPEEAHVYEALGSEEIGHPAIDPTHRVSVSRVGTAMLAPVSRQVRRRVVEAQLEAQHEHEPESAEEANDDADGDAGEVDDRADAPGAAVAADDAEETALTDLQKLIWNGIEAHGGCASFDQVVAEVAKYYGNLRRRDGSPYHSDCRRSVQASLSAHPHHPGRVFVRHATNKDLWLIAPEARSRAPPRDLPPQPVSHASAGLAPALTAAAVLESDASSTQSPMSTSSVPTRVPPSLALPAAPRSTSTTSLTDMQKLLIRIIMNAGGAAAFQHIIEQVSRQWSSLKRRDGSAYSSDSVRAVKASLSNNTYSVPIFKRDTKNPDLWLVADSAFADAVLNDEQPARVRSEEDVSASVSDESDAPHAKRVK